MYENSDDVCRYFSFLKAPTSHLLIIFGATACCITIQTPYKSVISTLHQSTLCTILRFM